MSQVNDKDETARVNFPGCSHVLDALGSGKRPRDSRSETIKREAEPYHQRASQSPSLLRQAITGCQPGQSAPVTTRPPLDIALQSGPPTWDVILGSNGDEGTPMVLAM